MGKRRRSKRKIERLRFLPCIVAIGLAAGYIVKSFGGEILEDHRYSSLRDKVVSESGAEEIIDEEVIKEPIIIDELEPEEIPEETEILESEEEQEVISDELLALGYDFKNIDFSELKSRDEATCGWIILAGTHIDYPIANATEESKTYYEHHDLDGNYSDSGTIYVDYKCNSLEKATNDLSDVTLIHGHHMTRGRMFADLCKFQENENFIDDHQFALIYTPDGYAYKLTFFAGVRVSGKSYKPVYRDSLADEEEFKDFVESLKANSSFESDVEVHYGDKIIGLSTCEYSAGLDSDYRYVLFATVEKQYTNELQMESSIDTGNVSCALK